VKRFSDREGTLTNYVIVVCGECGGYLLAKSSQKSRTCPYCGSKIQLEKAKKIAHAKKADEALAILRRLKEEAAAKHGKVKLQKLF
jgi:DNA-directed RNA polymerase subunit RPC12/RpoP